MKQTILITGASSGIGRAAALAFASADTNLILNSARNEAALAETCTLAEEKGANCIMLLGDAADYDFCRRLIELGISRFGFIDILINNAGISHIGLFQDMTPEQWERLLHVNLGSVINLSHLVSAYMIREHRGRIINISSVWGNIGASCEVIYSACKGGVNSFTKALAKELAPSGITVNAIAFGAVDTPMNSWLTAEEEEALCDEIPAGRIASAQEAARFIYQLSQAPEYLNGQIITFDGCWT